ncbi:MAG: hypothetical protein DWQ31_16475 [Planctomycetota bacterium]|nr:MAG: hypothetical protein DWQ31_16475 [Planctomycetota bacterium]REJ92848.1 MAG: hypothetical protein DWQ35_11425 [Planctomycetota bacterium]REK24629.1 MAG: hypothetical protein DWQ42_13395 [Planctomycetota bacterium]REK38355.1 MAG: hypothetical protein DWQ46_20740 [Planctomycetota bacterium]
MPQIERNLRREFRFLNNEALDDAMAEGTANCFVAFTRLYQKGLHNKAFARSLAHFAARQFSSGRRVGNRLSVQDPMSRYAQRQKGIIVERLDRWDQGDCEWIEPIAVDRRASIPDQVAMRIDVPAWFAKLSPRKQKIATDLAMGCSTTEVAAKHRVSLGRISQLRRELHRSWCEFQGESPVGAQST